MRKNSGLLGRSLGCILWLGGAIWPASGAIPSSAVHPAFEVKEIPLADQYHNMGVAFLSDGRMVILTMGNITPDVPNPDAEACVFLVSNTASLNNMQVTKIASGFRQPSGVNVVNDKIYVTDRDAFYSIPSNGNISDPAANKTKIMDWPMGGKWHQWVFTPVFKNGKFYAPYSGSIVSSGSADGPASSEYSGAFLSWDQDGKNLEKIAGGLRSPNGAGINDSGEVFVMDNQGSWLPACAFMHMKPGKFYGYRQSPPQAPNWAENLPYQPPAVWIPYPAQIAGASMSQPVYMSKGIYAGQWLSGDIAGSGLLRLSLESVNGDYQGAVFRCTNGMSNAAINRLSVGPDGALFIGTMEKFTNNWPGNGMAPMYKMSAKAGITAFEMLAIHSYQDGFEIEFTKPLDKSSALPANFSVKQWHYSRNSGYGCCKDPEEARTVSGVEVSGDGKRVFLHISGLKAFDNVVSFKLSRIKSLAGEDPWDTDAWYTLNNISNRTWSPAVASSRGLNPSSRSSSGMRVEFSEAGLLEVLIAKPGAGKLSLRSIDGALMTEKSFLSAGRIGLSFDSHGAGLGVLKLEQGVDIDSRLISF